MKDGLHPHAPGLEVMCQCLAPLIAKYAGSATTSADQGQPPTASTAVPDTAAPQREPLGTLNLAHRAAPASVGGAPAPALGLG